MVGAGVRAGAAFVWRVALRPWYLREPILGVEAHRARMEGARLAPAGRCRKRKDLGDSYRWRLEAQASLGSLSQLGGFPSYQ